MRTPRHTYHYFMHSEPTYIPDAVTSAGVQTAYDAISYFHSHVQGKRDKPISPGYMKEEDFYKEVTKDSTYGPLYQLYQYPTAFLLAKDITMDFIGLSDETKHTALASSFGASLLGSYGPISFGDPIPASGSHSHMQASPTANGLKVYIPGAQIIGYYCDVVPKFPNTIDLNEIQS